MPERFRAAHKAVHGGEEPDDDDYASVFGPEWEARVEQMARECLPSRLRRMAAGHEGSPSEASPAATEAVREQPDNAVQLENLLQAASNLDSNDFALVMSFITAINLNDGCSTPEEALILKLVGDYAQEGGIQPQFVKSDVEEFERDYALTVRNTRAFAARHRDLFAATEVR